MLVDLHSTWVLFFPINQLFLTILYSKIKIIKNFRQGEENSWIRIGIEVLGWIRIVNNVYGSVTLLLYL